jgi:hypothetical protein
MTEAAPSGVVTFLFTDIEGSTRRWETDAAAMRAALLEHDEVLRDAIESHGGFLFSHTGDGVVAAFASPRSAVDAAVAAQRALELPVRMGVATGEAELRDGDYFGTVLNRAARVMAAGHGGQILVADSTAGFLSRVDLLDLGPRRLRDVPVPVGVFQVQAPGLRTDFPSLQALDTTPGNLRPAATSLIGRESEIIDVEAAIKAHRLVTLTGVGGVGKTRLAMEVATRLADEFPDGVWVFELAAVTDPAAVPDAVAAVLGITQQPGKTVTESVAAALEGRIRLLVIDNCEHVLNAAADLIEAVLAQSATVRALATSREGLGVAHEQVQPVRSLDVAAGIDSAAVNLFVERAQGIAPGFSTIDGDDAAAVTEICQRLDGIPLAIELAASRMASMTASEIRDRLHNRFRLLVGSRRGLERHHTLRHAVAWSYDLLDEAEKTVLEAVRYSRVASTSKVLALSRDQMTSTNTPCSICSTLWCGSHCSSPISQPGEPGIRCSKRSANSSRNDLSPAARPPMGVRHMPATSPGAKPRSWPRGTAHANCRRTSGSGRSWPICARHFVGPPTKAIWTSRLESPHTRRSWAT